MIIEGETIALRPWGNQDIDSLVKYANNVRIWRNLRDPFPHPYTREDAESWVGITKTDKKHAHSYAITNSDECIGAVGLIMHDNEKCNCIEIGYWLGEPFWGQGIASEAVELLTEHAFTALGAQKLSACVYKWNLASGRVLEKNGFNLEDESKIVVYKDGEETEQFVYTKQRSSSQSQSQ